MSFDFASEFSDALSNLHVIWEQMGLEKDEMANEEHRLEEEIKKVFASFIESTSQQFHSIEQEIEDTLSKHVKLLRAFQYPESDVQALLEQPPDGFTLKTRLNDVKSQYQAFYSQCENQINEFKDATAQLNSLFEQLGDVSRAGFENIDDNDYSTAKLEQIKNKVAELKNEVDSRNEMLIQKKEHVDKLSAALGEDLPSKFFILFSSKDISNHSFEMIDNYIQSLEAEKDERVKQMSTIANEITRLWELLQIDDEERQRFLMSHSSLSHSEIESCRNELDRLRAMRNQRLPELIQTQKEKINGIINYMQIDKACPDYDNLPMEKAFELYENELSQLENEMKTVKPYIDLIKQREEYIVERDELQRITQETAKMQGKKPIDMKKVNREEQALRRIKSLLPRLEKKLLLLLIEYKDEHNGVDFIWKNEPYIKNLSHILLSDVEIKRAKQKKKSSLGAMKKDAAPISDKGALQKHSENNKKLVNFKL